MRRFGPALIAVFALACAPGGHGPTSSSASRANPDSSAPTRASQTQAADLRTQLDLLLGEQVMVLAKQAAAAGNHSDEFAGYAALLSVNSADLTTLARSAFGDSAAAEVSREWDAQNADLVEYTVGVVAHDSAKESTALKGLESTFVPQFARLLTSLTQLPLDPVTQLVTQQVLLDQIMIEDAAAQKYSSLYTDLHAAYAQSARLGDGIAPRIAQKFPDKFPGDPSAGAVDTRVKLNLLLQEHAYLATMMGDAVANGRPGDQAAAQAALASNADSLGKAYAPVHGSVAATQLEQVWSARDAAILAYSASADASSRAALTATFVSAFAAISHVAPETLAGQVTALLKVLDEQRAKSYASLARDDRSAATATQPVADGLVEG